MSSPVDFPFDVALVLRVGGDVVASWGDVSRARPLASVTKPIVAWSALVAVSQGALALDSPGGPEGATLRHLLAHASGLPLDSREPVAAPGKRRIYSNAGFDVIGGMVEEATGMPLRRWVARSVFGPLGMGMLYDGFGSWRIPMGVLTAMMVGECALAWAATRAETLSQCAQAAEKRRRF